MQVGSRRWKGNADSNSAPAWHARLGALRNGGLTTLVCLCERGLSLSFQYSEREQQRAPARRLRPIARDREELRRLLTENGVLHANPEQPIRGRDGRHAPWMFYSWNCSLTGRGQRSWLGDACWIAHNRSHGRQLATLRLYRRAADGGGILLQRREIHRVSSSARCARNTALHGRSRTRADTTPAGS